MPIKPGSSPISFTVVTSGVSGTLYCNDISFTRVIQNFDRTEFSNARLRAAPTTTGATPLIVPAFGNQPVQLLTTCTDDVPRPLTPDDDNIANIKQRFNIIRYVIQGAVSAGADVSNLYTVWADHIIRLNRFDLHLAKLQMDLSIDYITGMQGADFNYLTSTGLTFTGNALGGTPLTNMLITDYVIGVEYEARLPDGSGNSTVLYDFQLTIENRTITPQGVET